MNVLVSRHHEVKFQFPELEKRVEKVVDFIRQYDSDVALVWTGISGSLVGMPVAYQTKRPFAIVRKPDDPTPYADTNVEGNEFKKYLILDDFMESGGTVRRILAQMKTRRPDTECCGIILYEELMQGTSGKIQSALWANKFNRPVNGIDPR